jgi:hypothetical protein
LEKKGFGKIVWEERGSGRLFWKEKKGFTQITAGKGADLPWKGLADFGLRNGWRCRRIGYRR